MPEQATGLLASLLKVFRVLLAQITLVVAIFSIHINEVYYSGILYFPLFFKCKNVEVIVLCNFKIDGGWTVWAAESI